MKEVNDEGEGKSMGTSEGKPGKTGSACSMWVAGFIITLGAGLAVIFGVLT